MISLQEQLLKAGMVDKKKAKQLNQEKRKQVKQAKATGKVIVDESKEAAKRALAEIVSARPRPTRKRLKPKSFS